MSYGRLGKRVFYWRHDFKDVINGRKWQNSSFTKLNNNMLIINEANSWEYENMKSRGRPKGKNNPPNPGDLYYNDHPLKVDSNQETNVFTKKRQEIFVCGLGEKGSNEF